MNHVGSCAVLSSCILGIQFMCIYSDVAHSRTISTYPLDETSTFVDHNANVIARA